MNKEEAQKYVVTVSIMKDEQRITLAPFTLYGTNKTVQEWIGVTFKKDDQPQTSIESEPLDKVLVDPTGYTSSFPFCQMAVIASYTPVQIRTDGRQLYQKDVFGWYSIPANDLVWGGGYYLFTQNGMFLKSIIGYSQASSVWGCIIDKVQNF
jgi:hypothetical protein